jgi:hypothetical protein
MFDLQNTNLSRLIPCIHDTFFVEAELFIEFNVLLLAEKSNFGTTTVITYTFQDLDDAFT